MTSSLRRKRRTTVPARSTPSRTAFSLACLLALAGGASADPAPVPPARIFNDLPPVDVTPPVPPPAPAPRQPAAAPTPKPPAATVQPAPAPGAAVSTMRSVQY